MGKKMLSRQCPDIKFWRKIFEISKKTTFLRFIKNEAENKKSVLLEAKTKSFSEAKTKFQTAIF